MMQRFATSGSAQDAASGAGAPPTRTPTATRMVVAAPPGTITREPSDPLASHAELDAVVKRPLNLCSVWVWSGLTTICTLDSSLHFSLVARLMVTSVGSRQEVPAATPANPRRVAERAVFRLRNT